MNGSDSPDDAAADADARTGADPDRDPRAESTQVASEERRRKTSVVSGIVAVVGAWVALSVFMYDVGQAGLWNNVLVGAGIFLTAGYNYYRLYNDIPLSVGVAAFVAVLGLWLIVAAPLLAMADGLFWSTIVSGLLVAGLAGYNAYEAREARAVATGETGTS